MLTIIISSVGILLYYKKYPFLGGSQNKSPPQEQILLWFPKFPNDASSKYLGTRYYKLHNPFLNQIMTYYLNKMIRLK